MAAFVSSASWAFCRVAGACEASALWRGHRLDVVVVPAWPAWTTPVLLGTSWAVTALVTGGAAFARQAVLARMLPSSARAAPPRVVRLLPPSAICMHHHVSELPGAVRSKARLVYCMTLEQTGDQSRAMAAGRAEEAPSHRLHG